MGVVDEMLGVGIQFEVWGFAYTGNVLERSALISEGRSEPYYEIWWDKGAVQIILNKVAHGDEDYRPVKDFSALPWVVEHCIRGHAEWPGL